MKQIFSLPMLLTAVLLLAGCAGTPRAKQRQALEQWRGLRTEVEASIEKSTPEALRRAVELLDSPQVPSANYVQAVELSGLSGALFRILYPELDRAGQELRAPAYTGPYLPILSLAAEGKAPSPDEVQQGEGWPELVLPYLYLLRISAAARPLDAEQAARALELAATRYPDSVLPPYLRGVLAERQGDPALALSSYRQSLFLADSFYPARLRLAVLLPQSGKAGEAAQHLEKALESLPGNAGIRFQLAEAFAAAGNSGEASALAAGLLAENPENPNYLLLRARILRQAGDWSQALKPLSLLLLQHPESEQALILKALILYENAREAGQALELLRAGQEKFRENAAFPELIGRILLESGLAEEGVAELNRALQLEPGRISTLRLLLSDAIRQKRWLQAALLLSQILEKEQSEEDLLLANRIYDSLGDASQALIYAEKLYGLRPDAASAAYYASALQANGQAETAAKITEQALAGAAPGSARSRLLLLKALQALEGGQDTAGALELLQKALLDDPDNLQALLKISELYLARQEPQKAKLYLRRAVDLQPDDALLSARLRQAQQAAEEAQQKYPGAVELR